MEKNKGEVLKELSIDMETLLSIQEGGLTMLRKKADDFKLQKLREKIFAKKEQSDMNS